MSNTPSGLNYGPEFEYEVVMCDARICQNEGCGKETFSCECDNPDFKMVSCFVCPDCNSAIPEEPANLWKEHGEYCQPDWD